jgi:hypothetical protein
MMNKTPKSNVTPKPCPKMQPTQCSVIPFIKRIL